jgi:hypothetical protein
MGPLRARFGYGLSARWRSLRPCSSGFSGVEPSAAGRARVPWADRDLLLEHWKRERGSRRRLRTGDDTIGRPLPAEPRRMRPDNAPFDIRALAWPMPRLTERLSSLAGCPGQYLRNRAITLSLSVCSLRSVVPCRWDFDPSGNGRSRQLSREGRILVRDGLWNSKVAGGAAAGRCNICGQPCSFGRRPIGTVARRHRRAVPASLPALQGFAGTPTLCARGCSMGQGDQRSMARRPFIDGL